MISRGVRERERERRRNRGAGAELCPETCPQLCRFDPAQGPPTRSNLACNKRKRPANTPSCPGPRFESWRGAQKAEEIAIFLDGRRSAARRILSQESQDRRRTRLRCGPIEPYQDTSFASPERAAPCGARNTGCRRPAGPDHDWARLDRARPPARGLLHEAPEQAWLRDVLEPGRAGCPAGDGPDGPDARRCRRAYLRYLADDRQRKPSTVRDARSVIRNRLLPRFGERRLEDITEREVERWARRLGADRPLSNATKRKVIVIFHGVMARMPGLPSAGESRRDRGEAAARRAGRHRGLQPGGSSRPRPRRRVRAGRRDLPPGTFTACARASSSHCGGARSTSPARTSAYRAALRRAGLRPLRFTICATPSARG
jgi:hypothetical protein